MLTRHCFPFFSLSILFLSGRSEAGDSGSAGTTADPGLVWEIMETELHDIYLPKEVSIPSNTKLSGFGLRIEAP